MPEIGSMVDQLPPELAGNWATRGYYGTVSHNARAVYNLYLGYFSGNPAELNPLPPGQAAPRYVEMMGGSDAILRNARRAFDDGDYRWVAQLLQHLVYAQPDNEAARHLQADAFEQLAYQSEAATWRNFYVVGAKELREGVPDLPIEYGRSAHIVRNAPFDVVFDYLAVWIDSDKANGKTITVDFDVTDIGERRSLVLKRRVLNAFDVPATDADVTVKGTGAALKEVLFARDPEKAMQEGGVTTSGRRGAFLELLDLRTEFRSWFPIVTRPS